MPQLTALLVFLLGAVAAFGQHSNLLTDLQRAGRLERLMFDSTIMYMIQGSCRFKRLEDHQLQLIGRAINSVDTFAWSKGNASAKVWLESRGYFSGRGNCVEGRKIVDSIHKNNSMDIIVKVLQSEGFR